MDERRAGAVVLCGSRSERDEVDYRAMTTSTVSVPSRRYEEVPQWLETIGPYLSAADHGDGHVGC